MDLLGTHVPKVQVESRTGRPTAENTAASDLYAEPMNEPAMNQRSALCPKVRQQHPRNIPMEVYTCGEACAITQVTAQGDTRPQGESARPRDW